MDAAQTPVLPPFTVTGNAIEQISTLGGAVRIDVEEGGCCGSTYVFEQWEREAPVPDGDARYGCPGAWLLVGPGAAAVLAGSTLDYGARLKPPRFRVLHNPNPAHVCACRRSFGRPWPGPGQPDCRSYQPMPWDDGFQPPTGWRRQTGYRSASDPRSPT